MMRRTFLALVIAVTASSFHLPPQIVRRNTPFNAKSKKQAKGFGSRDIGKETSAAKTKEDERNGESKVRDGVSPDAVNLINTGAMRLAELEAQRASKKMSVLETAIDLTEEDEAAREGGGVIPEQVASRMTNRMWGFVGVPFGGCIGLFAWFYYQAKVEGVRYEPMLVASGTVGLLVVGLLGITYSLLSASWDEEDESEGLGGVATFNDNLSKIKEGVRRGRANVKARDTLESIGGVEEINRMREDLAKKEEAELKRRQSFAEKMRDEGL